jgi:hypothetical protein
LVQIKINVASDFQSISGGNERRGEGNALYMISTSQKPRLTSALDENL